MPHAARAGDGALASCVSFIPRSWTLLGDVELINTLFAKLVM